MSNYQIYYHPNTTSTKLNFDTTRKGAEIALQLQRRGITVTQPVPLTAAEAVQIHDPRYVRAIQTGKPLELAESQGFGWDEQMWDSVAAQNGAMRDATVSAIAGTPAFALSAGFHHARALAGLGFCTFNGVALAAHVARSHGVRRIIIVDMDAHHGGGTYSIVHRWPEVQHVDISTSRFDNYTVSDQHRAYHVVDADDYLATVRYALDDITPSIQPNDLLIHNAGMDPYEYCLVGGLTGISAQILAERETLIATWARTHQLRMVACLAGGYQSENFSQQELIDLHCMSVCTFLNIAM